MRPVLGDHLVAPAHRADGGGDGGAARVLERLSGLHERLLADHTLAFDFLYFVVRVRDDPVPAEEARGGLSGIGDRNRIGKDVAALLRVRLIGDENHARGNLDVVFLRWHGAIPARIERAGKGAWLARLRPGRAGYNSRSMERS